ncbi:kinesin light chain 1 [Xylariomycetidae sp. FL2044]|nr:kinesin light chain 1 [Xylariomycetidae sp. FL2044]
MRLLELQHDGALRLTKDLTNNIPPYAILSHTWGEDEDEVTFHDVMAGIGSHKAGYHKIQFCGKQAACDRLKYFWVDTCCINKADFTELSEAINSMFRWYQRSARCYVYLADVPSSGHAYSSMSSSPEWTVAFQKSRWFTRGWTLQELLAPLSVEFFSSCGERLGDKSSLAQQIQDITRIPVDALRGRSLSDFSIDQRMSWVEHRATKREEDRAYSILGIFQVYMPLIYGEESDGAFTRLREEIAKRQTLSLGVVPSTHTALWTVQFGRNKNFVGHEALLLSLLEKILPNVDEEDCQRTVIEGLGGIGKTQIALELAYRVHNRHPRCSVFWVSALKGADFENACRDIAKKLGLKWKEDEKTRVPLLVKDALSQETAGDWLMIVDNADDKDLIGGKSDLSQYLPFSRRGSILFTTRNHEMAVRLGVTPDNVFTLGEMTKPEALDLLQKGLSKSQTADVTSTEKVLGLLANLPLAIRQASAYMFKTGMTTTRYLKYCEGSYQTFVKLLSEDFEDRHRYSDTQNPIATTWVISFKRISIENALAARYLRFMCLLSEKQIPLSLLPPGEDELDTEEAIGALKGYAFINERENYTSFDMHRLVRLATQKWVKMEGLWQSCVSEAVQRLVDVFPNPQHDNRDDWLGILPHADAVLELCEKTSNPGSRATLFTRVAEGHGIIGKYDAAEKAHTEALALRQVSLGPEHPDTISTEDSLARTLRKLGKHSEAEKMHHDILTRARLSLGPEHPITLQITGNLASALQRQGKYDEAEKIHLGNLSMMESMLGRDHPSTLKCKRNVAYTLRKQGNYDKAEQLQREVLSSTEELFGPRHPDTLQNKNNLGSTRDCQGYHAEARRLYEETFTILEEVVGQEHPKTLKTKSNLARTLATLEQYEIAERMQREVLTSMEIVYGREHPHTLSTLSRLGTVLIDQEKYEEAEQVRRKTLELYRKVLGQGHPYTVKAVNDLDLALRMQDKADQAMDLRLG